MSITTKFPLPQTELLHKKVSTVPTACLDKLHPQSGETHPFVEYVDEGLWKSRITFHKDLSPSVLNNATRAQSKTYAHLDALCEAELKRRFPEYATIQGVKAWLKDTFPNLIRWIVGDAQFHLELTKREVNKYKKQIAYSACNRDDLTSCPHITDSTLRKGLRIADDTLLQTDHIFSKNSPMNGHSFISKGRQVHLTQAIACSNDRNVENTGNLRVVQTKDKRSICYTGRVDSDRKVREQAAFIFLNELKTQGKGITKTLDKHGKVIYQCDYVVNSLMSTPWIWSTQSLIAPFPERQYVKNEQAALTKLRENGPITIKDPNCPGQSYRVQCNPLLYSRSLNLFTRFKDWLPPFFTGELWSQKINKEGDQRLVHMAQKKCKELKQTLGSSTCTEEKKALTQKLQGLESCLKSLRGDLRPEEELLCRDYLYKLLDLPSVYHCKSSTDRTSITIALSTALQQWIDLRLPVPSTITDLIKDDRFKELFAANWMAGHQITRYARGGKGVVAGYKLNNKNLGLNLSRGIAQNPAIAPLVPERYLTDFPTAEKLKMGALYLLLLLPTTLLFYIPLTAIATYRYLCHKRDRSQPLKFTPPLLLPTLIFNFSTLFPSKVLNEKSPQVGARKLIAGGKNGGQKDNH